MKHDTPVQVFLSRVRRMWPWSTGPHWPRPPGLCSCGTSSTCGSSSCSSTSWPVSAEGRDSWRWVADHNHHVTWHYSWAFRRLGALCGISLCYCIMFRIWSHAPDREYFRVAGWEQKKFLLHFNTYLWQDGRFEPFPMWNFLSLLCVKHQKKIVTSCYSVWEIFEMSHNFWNTILGLKGGNI